MGDGAQGWLLVALLILVLCFGNDATVGLCRALWAACRYRLRLWWFASWPVNRRDRALRRAQGVN